jgi:hypothetical protein
MNKLWIRVTFITAAIYDGLLGLTFFAIGPMVYDYAGIERPNHMGYLYFPALLLIVFGLMFWRTGSDPVKYRDLIPYGIGLKISYCSVVFYYWLSTGIPMLWIPFAWIDLVYAFLFIIAWRKTQTMR